METEYTGFTEDEIKYLEFMKKEDEVKLWISIAIAFTGAANATKKEGATEWADHITDEYIKRFKR